MLFSEPKIPQFRLSAPSGKTWPDFSALQRAENSSIRNLMYMRDALEHFSALQRAENSSILLNKQKPPDARPDFSALQRAENSSIEDDVL